MKNVIGGALIFLMLSALVSGLSLLIAWPFMWIWNYAVVAALSVAKPISYWIAFWLMCFIGTFIATSKSSSK